MDNDFCKNIYSGGALYSDADEKALSEKMMLLYKDEYTRNDLITKGNAIAAAHSWQNAASLLWQTLRPVAAV